MSSDISTMRKMCSLWFSVDRDDNGQLRFEEFPQFNRLVKHHRQSHRQGSPCYTQLVFFIGDTGAGTSTLIRALLQRPWDVEYLGEVKRRPIHLPIAGRPGGSLSTSGDVHLYAAPNMDPTQQWRLFLYADCEGLGAGS